MIESGKRVVYIGDDDKMRGLYGWVVRAGITKDGWGDISVAWYGWASLNAYIGDNIRTNIKLDE